MISTYSAPGKVILCGEHAVVYDEPAIAVPFSAVRATVTAIPKAPGAGLIIHARNLGKSFRIRPSDVMSDAAAVHNGLRFATISAVRACGGHLPDLRLDLHSTIPIGGGLGSGAAVSTAVIRAICGVLNHPLGEEPLNALVYAVEKLYHGTPSGVDNTVIVYERPVYFVRSQQPAPIIVGAPLTLIVADSGYPGSTRETVARVRNQLAGDPNRVQPLIAQIGSIVRAARDALAAGDLIRLGTLLSENHMLLRSIGVSTTGLDRLVLAAGKAGAYGAKLSGGGGGGNIIALVAPERATPVMNALHNAGARHVWKTIVKQQTDRSTL